jgi:lipoate-protein ligase A
MRITLGHMPARQAIAADEALLDTPGRPRFWLAESPAVVVGLGLHHRLAAVVDLERCRVRGVEVVERRAGGGALLLDSHVLCGAVALPMSNVVPDVTESYRWLGDRLVTALAEVGIQARRVEVAEARADIGALRVSTDAVASALLTTCYGALSPHEVVVDTASGPAKLVGLAQVRRREAALFQFGILLRDQSPLADFLRVDAEADREPLREALRRRTAAVGAFTCRSASEVAAAIADAMPSAP